MSHETYFTYEKSHGTSPNTRVKNVFGGKERNCTLNLLIQCEIWPCSVEHKADILTGTEERYTRRSPSDCSESFSFFLVFITVMLEKPSSHTVDILWRKGAELK